MAKDEFNSGGSATAAAIGSGAGLLGFLLTIKSQKDILAQRQREQRAAELATARAAEAQRRAVVGAAQQTRGGLGLLNGLRSADRLQQQSAQEVAGAKMLDMQRQDAFDQEQRLRQERLGVGIGGAIGLAGTQLATAFAGPGQKEPIKSSAGATGASAGAAGGQPAQALGREAQPTPGYQPGAPALITSGMAQVPNLNPQAQPVQPQQQQPGNPVMSQQEADAFLSSEFPSDGRGYGQGLAVPNRQPATTPQAVPQQAEPQPQVIDPRLVSSQPVDAQLQQMGIGPAVGQLPDGSTIHWLGDRAVKVPPGFPQAGVPSYITPEEMQLVQGAQ